MEDISKETLTARRILTWALMSRRNSWSGEGVLDKT